jgi:capsular exopolysaccharide synthesis family protein
MPASTTSTAAAALELRDYLAVVRRRKALIALIAGVVVLATLGFSLTRTPLYEAKAQVLIQQRDSELILGITPASGDDAIRAEMQLMNSGATQAAIEASLGYLPDVELSAASTATPGVVISSTNADPEQAAKEANDFAEAYVAERRRTSNEDLAAAIVEIETQMGDLASEVAEAQRRIQELMVEIDATDDEARVRLLQAQIDQLQAQVEPNAIASRQSTLQSQLDRLKTAQASMAGRGRFVVATAFVPRDPVSPTPARDAALALAAGLVLGLAAAFLRDYTDDTLRTKEDLDAATGGVPVLGIIPAIDEWRDRQTALLETVSHPNSAASEAYRGLRTSIEFVAVDQKVDVIHVTSSTSGEGKSTTSANLAVTLARAGKRVILIDCDLRRPRLHHFFGMDNGVGFTSVVLGTTRIEDALQTVPGVPGLLVLPSGPPPPNPSELLSTKTVRTKLDALARSSDYVVIDSPPLLPVSDSVVISSLADVTLLVVTARTTARRSLHRSIEMLSQVNAPLEGLVFNGVGSEGTYGYGYGYGYTAYAPSRTERAAARAKRDGTTAEANGSAGPAANGSAAPAEPSTSRAEY